MFQVAFRYFGLPLVAVVDYFDPVTERKTFSVYVMKTERGFNFVSSESITEDQKEKILSAIG